MADAGGADGHTAHRLRHSLGDLLVAAVRAAVVAPERELKRWFSWRWYWHYLLVAELVDDERLERVDDHVTAVV